MRGRAAGQAEHEVGPPQLKAGCNGAAHQDGQGDRRVEPGDVADGLADQGDHHADRAVITEKTDQLAVT
jgi:hypothetical protein